MESTIHVSHPPIFIPWESGIPLPSVTAILVPLDVSTSDRHCFSMGVLARMGSGAFLGGGLGAEVEGSGFVDLGGCGFCGELLWGGFLGGEFMGFGVSLCVFFFFFLHFHVLYVLFAFPCLFNLCIFPSCLHTSFLPYSFSSFLSPQKPPSSHSLSGTERIRICQIPHSAVLSYSNLKHSARIGLEGAKIEMMEMKTCKSENLDCS